MTIKAKDFDTLVNKFGFQTRNSRDLLAWLEHEGKIIIRTKRSHTKGKDLPFQHAIRQQLKLNESELEKAISCKLSREDYLALLKNKGIF
jgi:transcription initiation factor IIE alpha subunit